MNAAVSAKPMLQKTSSDEAPYLSITAPDRTEERGTIPCDPMLVMLLTLLSMLRSTSLITAVLTGMLIPDTM